MIKRLFITLVGLLVVVGAIAGIKALQIKKMIDVGNQNVPPPETVTTATARSDSWETLLPAVGSLEAVQGVMVAAELSGKVVELNFESGSPVPAGKILLRQDITSEQAQLPGAEAAVELASYNFV